MNLLLDNVVSHVTGRTGMDIIHPAAQVELLATIAIKAGIRYLIFILTTYSMFH
jgi:hypothetical protein